jgi:hypothetical protein
MRAENLVPGKDWLLLRGHGEFHSGQILAALEQTGMDKPRLRAHREHRAKQEEKHRQGPSGSHNTPIAFAPATFGISQKYRRQDGSPLHFIYFHPLRQLQLVQPGIIRHSH